jgi:hypothetical protein
MNYLDSSYNSTILLIKIKLTFLKLYIFFYRCHHCLCDISKLYLIFNIQLNQMRSIYTHIFQLERMKINKSYILCIILFLYVSKYVFRN